MAFNINEGRQQFIATASQTIFNFNFCIFTDTDLKVYKTPSGNTPGDTADILTIGTHYTVSINGTSGGTVTLTSGASLNDTITIVRDLPITRTTDYQSNGDLYAATLDTDQDYQTYLIQDRQNDLTRAITLPNTVSPNVSVEMPSPIGDAYFKWNSSGTAIENDTTIPSNLVLSEQYKDEAQGYASTALTQANRAEDEADRAEGYAISFDPSNLVHKTGDEIIADVKTFTSSPIVPTPTTNMQVANKQYVDDNAETTWLPNDSRAKTALNATGTAPIYACRAWVNFNGTGTVAIRASGNVSSITDNGTGNYTVNFTTAMPDVNYCMTSAATGTSTYPIATSSAQKYYNGAYTTSYIQVLVSVNQTGAANLDADFINLSFFR